MTTQQYAARIAYLQRMIYTEEHHIRQHREYRKQLQLHTAIYQTPHGHQSAFLAQQEKRKEAQHRTRKAQYECELAQLQQQKQPV